MTIIRERVAETIGLVLWFGVLDQDNFSRTSTCGREKVLGKDILVYFKMMIKFFSGRHQYCAVLWKRRMKSS